MNRSLVEDNFSISPLLDTVRTLASADRLWRPVPVSKAQVLFDQDTAPADLFVLTQGLVKLLYITPDGTERIKSFIVDKGLFAAETGGPAFAAHTLEHSTLVRLPLSWVIDQLSRNDALRRSYGQFTDWVRRRKSIREQALLCNSAAERFQIMAQREPELLGRLPQGDIAKYLGITPIAFSRIKRRLVADTQVR